MDSKESNPRPKITPVPPVAGIFQIQNAVNGKILIGSSPNLHARKNRFEFEVQNGLTSLNAQMRQDWARYGKENFSFRVLDEIKPTDDPAFDRPFELAKLEKKWLAQLQPYGDRGYNVAKAFLTQNPFNNIHLLFTILKYMLYFIHLLRKSSAWKSNYP